MEIDKEQAKDQPEVFTSGWGQPVPRSRKGMESFRFYLSKGQEKKIILLSDEPEGGTEHHWAVAKRWDNFATCSRPKTGQCAFCDFFAKKEIELKRNGLAGKKLKEAMEHERYWAAFLPILDLTETKTDDGRIFKNQVRLVALKESMYQKLGNKIVKIKAKKELGSLKNSLWEVSRSNILQPTPSVGDEWEFVEIVDITKEEYHTHDKKPAEVPNVRDVLRIKTEVEVQEMIGQLKMDSGQTIDY